VSTNPPESPVTTKRTKRRGLFWSRYITCGPHSTEEFDLRRFFDDAEYIAIKVLLLVLLVITLCEIVILHLK
jgi:hypothetical protein